jgi:hypothetical protein
VILQTRAQSSRLGTRRLAISSQDLGNAYIRSFNAWVPRTLSAPDLSPVADYGIDIIIEATMTRQLLSSLGSGNITAPTTSLQGSSFQPFRLTLQFTRSKQMKIIIIGAGLSGLTTALALQKYVAPQLVNKEPLEIKVYDESQFKSPGEVEYSWRDHSDIRNQHGSGKKKNQGAAISLQSNAFKVLGELDANLADRVHASGLPTKGFTWKSRGDWLLGRDDLEACLISRPVLIECLMEALLKSGVKVEYRSVREVECREGRKPVVRLSENGGYDEVADLVVGADGIRSVVRKSFFGDGEEVRPKYL